MTGNFVAKIRQEPKADAAKHLPAYSVVVEAFGLVRFALAGVIAFRQTLCG